MDAIAVYIQITVQQQRAYDKARGKMPLGDWIKAAADEAAKRQRTPKSFCPYCGRRVCLNKDGGVRCHDLPGSNHQACPGRYSPPINDPEQSILGRTGHRE